VISWRRADRAKDASIGKEAFVNVLSDYVKPGCALPLAVLAKNGLGVQQALVARRLILPMKQLPRWTKRSRGGACRWRNGQGCSTLLGEPMAGTTLLKPDIRRSPFFCGGGTVSWQFGSRYQW